MFNHNLLQYTVAMATHPAPSDLLLGCCKPSFSSVSQQGLPMIASGPSLPFPTHASMHLVPNCLAVAWELLMLVIRVQGESHA